MPINDDYWFYPHMDMYHPEIMIAQPDSASVNTNGNSRGLVNYSEFFIS
jgi:hypothetical protein